MARRLRRDTLLAAIALSIAVGHTAPAARPAAVDEPVVIPFDLSTRHIIVQVTVNKSRPLSFVFDTGADAALVKSDVAKELGLKLEGQVNGRGAGPDVQQGSLVKDAKCSLIGLAGTAVPINIALPLPAISSMTGRQIDGIIGGQFIKQFVVEIDYPARRLRLHKPGTFTYTGSGESIPIDFTSNTQPTLEAIVTPNGGQPISGRFLFDLGSGLALALHSPFVAKHQLPSADTKTIRAIGGAGVGGATSGLMGRVASLQVGSTRLPNPITLFSTDRAGSFANAALSGNIGAQVGMRFRLFLDYGRKRIIFEPLPGVTDPFDRAYSGLAIRAFGDDFRTFRVSEVLEQSPAAEAGVERDDVIEAIDGVPAHQLTLSMILEMLEKPVKYSLTIRRGDRTITIALTPARLI